MHLVASTSDSSHPSRHCLGKVSVFAQNNQCLSICNVFVYARKHQIDMERKTILENGWMSSVLSSHIDQIGDQNNVRYLSAFVNIHVGRYVPYTYLQTLQGPGSGPPPPKGTCPLEHLKDLEVVPHPEKHVSNINCF